MYWPVNLPIYAIDNVAQIRHIIQSKLPVPNKKLAEVLILFVGLLLDNIEQNRLSPNEVSVIFSSFLIRPGVETIDTVVENSKRCNLVLMLSKNFDKIFPKQEAIRSIIKKHEPPELYEEKQTIRKYKETLKAVLKRLKDQLDKMNQELDNALSLNDVKQMAHLLKGMKESFEDYCNEKVKPTPTKFTHDFVCTTLLETGHSSMKGPRPQMEDRVTILNDMNQEYKILTPNVNRAFFGVYDGHSGAEVAEMAATMIPQFVANERSCQEGNYIEAMRSGIIKADDEICSIARKENIASGATLATCMIVGETLYVSNLGDSEIVLGQKKDDSPSSYNAMVISSKHKPTDDKERDRIVSAGGLVFRGRVNGRLAVSRALGDVEFKYPKTKGNYISNEPYVNSLHLNESHSFLILACDGLWDKVSYQEAVDFVHEHRVKGKTAEEISLGLCQLTLDKGSKDNVTVIVVFLKWRPVQA